MKRKRGSAILVIIILSIAFSSYVSSAVLSNSHFISIRSKYEDIINEYYSKDINNLSNLYDELDNINKKYGWLVKKRW